MIAGLKNTFQELLGNISRFWYLHGPKGPAFRADNGITAPYKVDVTDGEGTGGETSTDWNFLHLRNLENIDFNISTSPNYDYINHGGDFNNAITLFDLMGRIADIQFAIDGDTTAIVTYNNQFGFIHTSGSLFNAGDVVFCKETSIGVYEFTKINRNIAKAIITRSAVVGTISLDADWLYEWNGSVWRKKCDAAAATPGIRVIREDFAYNSGTTAGTTATIPTGAVITRVEVIITTAFDGTGSTVQVDGGGISSLMPTTVPSPYYEGLYINDLTSSITHKAIATSTTGVTVTVVEDGSSMGDGYTLVYFAIPEE